MKDIVKIAITLTDSTGKTYTKEIPVDLKEDIKENNSNLLDSKGAYLVDDFSKDTLDLSKWKNEIGYVRNGELQNYVKENSVVKDNLLELRARKDSNGNWTSSSIITHGKFTFKYGRIEARIKFCDNYGSFPAFWMLGDSFEFGYKENTNPDVLGEWWPYCGETDIVEFYNYKFTSGVFYGWNTQVGRVYTNKFNTSGWHIFSMDWNEDGSMIFYIDGEEISRTSSTDDIAMHIPNYLLVNQAVGAAGGTPSSDLAEMTTYVDWIKYYPLDTKDIKLYTEDFELNATDYSDNNCKVRVDYKDNSINKVLEWKSSDSSIVEVHSGFCVARADKGSAIITATSPSGVSKDIEIEVNNYKIVRK